MDPSILINWTSPFPNLRVSGVLFFFLFYFKQMFLLANSQDPDQTLCSAASDLGLHCLPMSRKRNTRLIWVNNMADSFIHILFNQQTQRFNSGYNSKSEEFEVTI